MLSSSTVTETQDPYFLSVDLLNAIMVLIFSMMQHKKILKHQHSMVKTQP